MFRHAILSIFESESYIQSLRPLSIQSINQPNYQHQQSIIQQLNQQAHLDAQTRHDEFLIDCLCLNDKVPVLVNQLIGIECYHTQLVNRFLNRKSKNSANYQLNEHASLKLYLHLYYEATLINLLEVAYYHKEIVESVSQSINLELIDYCARRLIDLNTKFQSIKDPEDDEQSIKQSSNTSKEELINQSISQFSESIRYQSSVCAVSIMRYLTDRMSHLSISLIERMMNDKDVLSLVVPLIVDSPFKRRVMRTINTTNKQTNKSKQYVTEKYIDGAWKIVEGADSQAACLNELQLWMIVCNLMHQTNSQSNYNWTAQRQENMLRLRPLLNSSLLDQLPMLADLKRFVEELSIIAPPQPKASPPFIEIVPEIYDSVCQSIDWDQFAEEQVRYLNDPATNQSIEQSVLDSYSTETLEAHMQLPVCQACHAEAAKRCSLCQRVFYCSRNCQKTDWKTHKVHCTQYVKEKAERDARIQAKVKAVNAEPEEAKESIIGMNGYDPSVSLPRKGPLIELLDD